MYQCLVHYKHMWIHNTFYNGDLGFSELLAFGSLRISKSHREPSNSFYEGYT